MTLVHLHNTGKTGWTRSRSSLRFTLSAIELYNSNPTLTNFDNIRHCIAAIPAPKQLQYSAALQQLKGVLDTEEDTLQAREEVRRLQENTFNVKSSYEWYAKSFGEAFVEATRGMSRTGRWLDGGAGEARAMIEYLEKHGRGSCIAIGYDKPANAVKAIDAATRDFAGRFKYIDKKFFSEIHDDELDMDEGGFDLITDLNGVLYYTRTLEEDLARYLRLLKVGGILVFTSLEMKIDMPRVDGHDRRMVSDCARWASNFHGAKLTLNRKTGSCTMTKVSDRVTIPTLVRDNFKLRDGRNDPLREYSCTSSLPNAVVFA